MCPLGVHRLTGPALSFVLGDDVLLLDPLGQFLAILQGKNLLYNLQEEGLLVLQYR
jgi:hypothetical protein